MVKYKEFEIQVPIDGEPHIYKTDLICNSCGKKLKNGDYLYFCMKEHDDLCSNYNCLKKHAGHRFFRWGKIESGSPHSTSPDASSKTSNKIKYLPGPALPTIPAAPADTSPPIKIKHVPFKPIPAPAAPPPAVPSISSSIPIELRPAPPSKGSVIVTQPTVSEGPVIRSGLGAMNSLRSDMLKELRRLKSIIKGE
ncbi:MAG: hypothetical protein ACTSRS_16015 [Candidatus Helarchaeota archaeon]